MIYWFYAGLSLVFCLPLLLTSNKLGTADWDQHLFYYGAVLKNIIEYKQFPFWNPWYCGGNVLWQNPQIALLSPVYPLTLLVSLPMAMKLNIALHYFLGTVGMHKLLRKVFNIQFVPFLILLIVIALFSGSIALHIAAGHSTFLPFAYGPWVLYGLWHYEYSRQKRYFFLAAFFGALMIYNGGIHIFIMFHFGLAVYVGVYGILTRSKKVIGDFSLYAFFTAVFSAPKLIPVIYFLHSPFKVDTRALLDAIDRIYNPLQVYLDPYSGNHERMFGFLYTWHEYGNYIGAFAYILILTCILSIVSPDFFKKTRWQQGLALAISAIFLLLMSQGSYSIFAPFEVLRHLPLLNKFRNPGRYTIPFVLFIALYVGWFVQNSHWSWYSMDARLRRWLSVLLILASAEIVMQNRGHFDNVFNQAAEERSSAQRQAPTLDVYTSPHRGSSPMYRGLLEGRDVLRCYEALQTQSGVNARYNFFYQDSATSTISSIEFSPNAPQVKLGPSSVDTRVYLNQNYIEGWSASPVPLEYDPEVGLAYVIAKARAEGQSIEFSFVPPGLYLGLLIFLGGILLAMLFWLFPKRTLSL